MNIKNYLLTFLDGVWFFILALFVSLVSTSVLCLSCKIAFFAVFIFLFCFDWNCFSEHCLYVRTENVRNCLSFWLIFWMRGLPPFTTKTKTLLLLPGESLPSCTIKLYDDARLLRGPHIILFRVPWECYWANTSWKKKKITLKTGTRAGSCLKDGQWVI